MQHDLSGTPTRLGRDALGQWDAMTAAFLAHGRATPDHLGAVLEAEPDAPLPTALKGIFCVLLARREMTEEAAACLRRARRLAAGDSHCGRTQAYIRTLDLWLQGAREAAVGALEEQVARHPRDTLSVKIVHGMRFMLGDASGMLASLDRVLAAHDADHPYRGYVLGCRAFALEETGAYGAAERAGMAALGLATDDAWGLHAVAHVHDMTHRPDAGIALLDRHRENWSHCNNFGYHVWWHKALLHLDRGETDIVLALYDTKIRAEHTDDYRDISNATSLLMRLELEGVNVGERWDELAALSEARAEDGQLVFADLHYMLALMGGKRTEAAERLQRALMQRGTDPGPLGTIARHPGRAAIDGLSAFGEGRYEQAFRALSAALDGLARIGGSHAQRDIFVRIAIDAALRSGHPGAAERMIAARCATRAGAEDRFAETRRARIAALRDAALGVPVQ